MASVSRRLFLVALLVAAVAVVFASAVCDSNCKSCVADTCISCASGYYPTADGCTTCGSANCDQCEALGWCVKCQSGYRLEYVTISSSDATVNKYGKCVNAASFVSAQTALVAAAAALVYAVAA